MTSTERHIDQVEPVSPLYEPEDDCSDEYEPDAYVDGYEFYDDECLWET